MFYSILFLELLKYHEGICKNLMIFSRDQVLALSCWIWSRNLCLGFQPRYPDLHLVAAHLHPDYIHRHWWHDVV